MSDFAQQGLISTLQRLNDSHLPKIEAELAAIAPTRPIALVLPCHGRDLDRPAFAHVLSELRQAEWLGRVVVSLNGVEPDRRAEAEVRIRTLPQPVDVLWNDEAHCGLPSGKGANVHVAIQHLAALGGIATVALQDCDVASFRSVDLARLCYAVTERQFGFRFAKAYYSRVTDRLYGRVSRLFLAPLLQAVLRVGGHHPLVDFLHSFRYPLSGEVAVEMSLAAELPAVGGWSLELAHLCEVFRRIDPREVCQVDGGTGYDHKHQPAATALTEMAGQIACELYAQLAQEGLKVDADFRAAVARVYRRESTHAVRRSVALARINSLPMHEADESDMIAGFAARLDDLICLSEHC